MNKPTPFPALDLVLAKLVAEQRAVLADKLVGFYLQGGFALGNADLHSDVDFIAVVEDELSDDEVSALQFLHGRVYDLDCAWAQHLEGSYFPREVLRDSKRRNEELWYLDHGHRHLERSTHCNTLVVRWTLQERGIVLFGPEPRALIDELSVESLRQEILATARDWEREILDEPERFANRFYQGFIVLSYCRMLHDLHAGRPGSKRDAADWAKANLDPQWAGLIDRAWNCRPDPARSVREAADPRDFALTLGFLRTVTEAAEQCFDDSGFLVA